MSNQEWRVLDGDGNNQGPYTVADLQSYYASGHITHSTLVWTEGFADWIPAGQVEGLLPPPPAAPVAAPLQAPVAQPIQSQPVQPIYATAPPAAPERTGAPAWISATTLTIGVASLIFFFFPWVSASMNVGLGFGTQDEMVEVFTQSGFQSITAKASISESYLENVSKSVGKLLGMDEEAMKKEMEENSEEVKKAQEEMEKEINDDLKSDSSILNLIAMIVIGLAVVAAIVGLTSKLSSLVITAQGLLTIGALLIGIQMALQFPVIQAFTEKQEEGRKKVEEIERESAEMLEASGVEVPDESKPSQKTREAQLYETSFKPNCFVTVGLLSVNLILVVITLSATSSTPLIVPQGGYQTQQPGQVPQPQQPGGGLKFH